MNKEEYLEYLDLRAAESDKWAERLKDDVVAYSNHLGSAWAFRLARMVAEELND